MLLGNLNLIGVDGTFSLPNDTSEHDLIEILSTEEEPTFLFKINFDMINLVQNVTFRVYYKVDNVNYRLRYGTNPTGGLGGTMLWTTSDAPWFVVSIQDIIDHDLKVTIQSSINQGSVLDIPWSYNGGR